jgi:uncharacterized damage-inducible protein DinB
MTLYERIVFMAEQKLPLTTFYQGWDAYQDLLVKAIAPLSTDQLALRAAPHLRTIGENIAHIIGPRFRWFAILIDTIDIETEPMATWDRSNSPARSAAELVAGLEASWQMMQQALVRWTAADLADIVEDIDEGKTYTFTRQWVIWHLIEHDIHHGGEISLMLGMHNLAAIDL